MEIDFDAAFQRIDKIIGGENDPAKAAELWFAHLRDNLELPCEVSGLEDFRWEEPYVLGVGDPGEYQRLCRRQPSYVDVFTLERIEPSAVESEWRLHSDDFGASVTRNRDGRPFLLGLSELTAIDHEGNDQLLRDFSIWLVNYR